MVKIIQSSRAFASSCKRASPTEIETVGLHVTGHQYTLRALAVTMLVHPQLFHCLFVEDQALLALVEAVMRRVWSYLTAVLAVACAQALQMPCKTMV